MDLINKGTVDYYIAEKPLEFVNGDIGFISDDEKQLFVGIVDGAGHGPEAHEIAQVSRNFLEKNKDMKLPDLMKKLHENLRGTRGGVAIIGKLDHKVSRFNYVGIGNIVLRKFGNSSERVVTQNGIIGYQIRTPKEKFMQISGGDILVMHTDGISSYFDEGDYSGILKDDAKTIANNLIKKFGKGDDDATCIVIRFK
jgi:negative regulator of sigma-B (phosphoserine phosphatase)